jgi:preprotein translocase subunit SecD
MLAMAACDKSGERQMTTTIERANLLRFQVVDHDSDYMRRVVAHVATDPTAIGITAREDFWTTGHDNFLEAHDRARLESYFKQLQANPNFIISRGHELAFEQTAPGTWRSFYLHSPVALDGNAIDKATTRDSLVMLDLTDDAAKDFGIVTARIAGGKLAAVSRGEVLAAPVVMDQIAGGRVSISLDSDAAADQLARALDALEE